jgi:trk system potassium uptake protein TrkH
MATPDPIRPSAAGRPAAAGETRLLPAIDLRPVNTILGILLALLSVMMTLPALVDLVNGNEEWVVFAAAAVTTGFVGGGLWLAGRQSAPARLSIRQTFLLTSLSWIVLSAFAALPFMWAGPKLSFTRAFFETMSGLTTTGATMLSGLDQMPPGILLWRSLLHWYGGVGIIVVAIAILPMLQIGGMQLFRTESSDKSDKILPRAAQIAGGIVGVYALLTLACMSAYFVAGMPIFDAINHAMSTLSTGGFSTHDSSLGFYKSPAVEYVAIVFMLAGALPMLLFVSAFTGRVDRLWTNAEVRLFFAVVLFLAMLSALQQMLAGHATGEEAIRNGLFNVTTLITTTGFVSTDYTNWGAASDVLFFLVMFLGGCTGSTSGGLKAFRIGILGAALIQHLKQMIYPSGVFPVRWAGASVPDDVVSSVFTFLFMYAATFLVLGVALNLGGYDLRTAFSAAIACLGNVGPGLGPVVGPATNFAALDDITVWLLSFAMFVGRLELFTVYVLFLPRFWRG